MCQITTESDSIFLIPNPKNEMEGGVIREKKRNSYLDEIWDFQAVVEQSKI